jgi:CheY-like chemotaxis protein
MFAQARVGDYANAGLGIGLALVRELVQRHGGSVEAHSAGPGTGSEFVVRLPLLARERIEPEEPQPVVPEAESSQNKLHILIADDNEDAAATMAMVLRIDGHDVTTARDGLEALEIAERLRPEAIVLDLGMPRLDGYATARRMRERPWGRGACLIALSGWGQEEDKRRATEAGFDEHLTKPVDPAQVAAVIARCPTRT